MSIYLFNLIMQIYNHYKYKTIPTIRYLYRQTITTPGLILFYKPVYPIIYKDNV